MREWAAEYRRESARARERVARAGAVLARDLRDCPRQWGRGPHAGFSVMRECDALEISVEIPPLINYVTPDRPVLFEGGTEFAFVLRDPIEEEEAFLELRCATQEAYRIWSAHPAAEPATSGLPGRRVAICLGELDVDDRWLDLVGIDDPCEAALLVRDLLEEAVVTLATGLRLGAAPYHFSDRRGGLGPALIDPKSVSRLGREGVAVVSWRRRVVNGVAL